jgi:hypothetical protein
MLFAPLEGWRHVKVMERRTAIDYAHVLKDVSDTHFKNAEARRLVEHFEWHYTLKHGSWLDMAESELAVLTTQCLSMRIRDRQTLEQEVAAWLTRRNANHAKADWRFTTANARIKLKRVDPAF